MQRTIQRIGLWVLVGAAVTCFWVLFGMLAHPRSNFGRWPLVAITMPASLFWQHRPVTYHTVLLLNAAIYGLVGLALEPLLRLRHQLPARLR